MKRTLCLSALFVVCATIAVSGQSMNEKLQQLLGGSHSAKQEEATPPTYPSEEALLGVWTYQAPSIEYKGDDMFASIAVAGLQDQLATHYVKAGLVPGQGTVSFKKRNRLHASMGGHEIDGTYSYDPGADAPVRCRRCARSRAALLSGIRCERENAANRLRHAKLSRHHAGRTVEKIATRNIKTGLCRNENFRHNP